MNYEALDDLNAVEIATVASSQALRCLFLREIVGGNSATGEPRVQSLGIKQELQPQYMVAVVGTFPLTLVVPQVAHFHFPFFRHLAAHAEVQAALLETIYRARVVAGGVEAHCLLGMSPRGCVTCSR